MSDWTTAFGRSSVSPAVFPVRPEVSEEVAHFLDRYPLPAAATRGMYEPITEGVAFLDGGLHRIDSYGYGMTTLHTGRRIIGWQALRLLCGELGLRPPARRLVGERAIPDPSELANRFASIRPSDPDGQRRAGIIAGVVTGSDLREACRRLIGDHAVRDSP